MSKNSRHNEMIAAMDRELEYSRESDERDRELAIERDDYERDFAKEKLDYSKFFDQRNYDAARADSERIIGGAEKQTAYRKGIAADMLASAEGMNERVGEGELTNRLGIASSDATRAHTKGVGIRDRQRASYGINPNSGQSEALAREDTRNLTTYDVASRNAVRRGTREENRGLAREKRTEINRARLADMGLTDASLGVRDSSIGVGGSQLGVGGANVNAAQLGLQDRVGGVLSRNTGYAESEYARVMSEGSNSGLGALLTVGGAIVGGIATGGNPAGVAAGAAIGGAVGGYAGGGGGGDGYYGGYSGGISRDNRNYYGGGRVAPGGSFGGPAPGTEGTGFEYL